MRVIFKLITVHCFNSPPAEGCRLRRGGCFFWFFTHHSSQYFQDIIKRQKTTEGEKASLSGFPITDFGNDGRGGRYPFFITPKKSLNQKNKN